MSTNNQPPNKRQKLNIKSKSDVKEDEDDDILDLTTNNSNSIRKKPVSNKQKLSHLGGVTDEYGIPINLLTIKYDIIDVKLSDKHLIANIIDTYNGEKTAFAKGIDHYFVKKIGKNGRKYYQRVKFDPNAPWASKVPKGGGASKYTQVEEILFEANCILVVQHGHKFGIVPEQGILGKDNIRIFADFYRIFCMQSRYAELYPQAVFMRDHPSLRKKLKSYTDQWQSKKSTDPKAMRIKSHFGGWPLKYNIVQTNDSCLLQSKENRSKDKESTNISRPSKGKGTSNMLHEIRSTLVTMTDQLQSNIDKSSSIQSLQSKSICDIIPTTVAIPPVPPTISLNNNNNNIMNEDIEKKKNEFDSMIVYEFIDQFEVCVVSGNITKEKGEQLTDLVLISYHDPKKHERTQNLIKFVNKKGNILKYLSLIEKDLNL